MNENAYEFNIMNSIPCEFCTTLIDLQDYEEHARECRRRMDPFFNFYNSLPNLIDRIAENLQNMPQGEQEQELEQEQEYEIEEPIQDIEDNIQPFDANQDIEDNIQPFDANGEHYEFFDNHTNQQGSLNPPFQETSLNSFKKLFIYF